MFVAATSRCFCDRSWEEAIEQLAELEFSYLEIMIHEEDGHIKPAELITDFSKVLATCRETSRLTPVALSLDSRAEGAEYFKQFEACCRLAAALRVVTITVRSAELGTPFNAEVERLVNLVRIGALQGVKVCLLTEAGRMSHDPLSAATFCNYAKGLGITLDPSYYVYKVERQYKLDPILPFVRHLRLRDTRPDAFQVRVGQGEIEYGKLLNQLGRFNYDRALCVDMKPQPGVDHVAELRKIRLLLESLL